MKTITAILVALCVSAHWANAQTASASPLPVSDTTGQTAPSDTPYVVVDRGANHRVWQKTTYETTPDGQKVPRVHQYTELATGMHYKEKGQWKESRDEIEILPNGTAAAVHGQHQAYFPGNINQGVIELATPNGKHLKSRPLGLSYDDGTKTVLIAELKSSVGEVHSPNMVIYPDAFTDFQADVRYTYTISGFEQDIILHERPPGPEVYGLNPATTRIEVLTEFFNPPTPVVEKAKHLKKTNGTANGDETLHFGAMVIGRGKAFSQNNPDKHVPVDKQWTKLEGRDFLIEEVSLENLGEELRQLPSSASLNSDKVRRVASVHRDLPAHALEPAKTNSDSSAMKLAGLGGQPAKGLVLDYVLLNASLTNYTFRGDTTYYITRAVNLYGTTVLEGGAVLKYTNKIYRPDPMLGLSLNGPLDCRTAPYRPAVFTSRNDDSVGETIAGSTGNPSNTNTVATAIKISDYAPPGPVRIHDVQMRFFKEGIRCNFQNYWASFFCPEEPPGPGDYVNTSLYGYVELRNCQFYRIGTPIAGNFAVIRFHNILEEDVGSVFSGIYFHAEGENLTAHKAGWLALDEYETVNVISYTNSILANVTNGWSVGMAVTSANSVRTNDTGVFQTVGAGAHYLAANSPYRNVGTTNIDYTLLAALKTKTTYPPLVLTNTILADTALAPAAQRDVDLPDLGYHYDPIDYLSSCIVSNATLTISNGAVLAYNYSDWAGAGIRLFEGSQLISQGTANARNFLVDYRTVQEGSVPFWTASGSAGSLQQSKPAVPFIMDSARSPSINLNFTTVMSQNGNIYIFYTDYNFFMLTNFNLSNCELYAAGATLQSASSSTDLPSRAFLNNLFVGHSVYVSGGKMITHNNLFIGRTNNYIEIWNSGDSSVWTNQDNAFDGCESYIDGTIGHNAYLNGAMIVDSEFQASDIIANLTWVTGPWGAYYQPANSPLINAGSVTANALGLYHFTTQTNQVKETNSVVDIGYHYVAVDANSNPIDTDGDGIPDYLEDSNGNGLYDTGDLSHWLIGCFNGLTTTNGLILFTPLK